MAWTPATLNPAQWYDVPTEAVRSSFVNGMRVAQVNAGTDLGAAAMSDSFAYPDGAMPAPWARWINNASQPLWVIVGGKAKPSVSSGVLQPCIMHPLGQLDPWSTTHEFDLTWDASNAFFYWPRIDGSGDGYYLLWNTATFTVTIAKFTGAGSVSATLATSAALAVGLRTGTHHWKVVCAGPVITLFDENNNQIVTASSWDWSAAVWTMLEVNPTGAATTIAVDNWSVASTRSYSKSLANWTATAGVAPTLVTAGIGGLPSLVFNGTSTQLLTCVDNTVTPNAVKSDLGVGSPFTVLMVADGTTASGTQTYYSRFSGAGLGNWQLATASWLIGRNGWLADKGVWNDGVGDSYKTSATMLADGATPHSIVHRCDGTNAGNKVYVDGTSITPSTNPQGQDPANSDVGFFALSSLAFQASTSFSGRISEVVVLDRAITDLERAQWDDYVHTKYGIGITDPLATGSLTLGASASAKAVTVAAGSLALTASGSAKAAAAATASLSLTGSATAAVQAVASGLLTLLGLASAGTTSGGSGALTLLGALAADAPVGGTGVLVLNAQAQAAAEAIATGLLSLLAQATAESPSGGSALLSLLAGAEAGAELTASALLSLLAVGSARAPESAAGALTLQATAQARAAVVSATASLDLEAVAAAVAHDGATALLVLAAVAAAQAKATANAHLELLAVALAIGHLGQRARVQSRISRNPQIGSRITIGTGIRGSDTPVSVVSGQDSP